MTEPLTAPDCDCRGLPFMPLEVSRLIDSDLTALSTGDEFKAAVLLWAKCWGQVPAASIPDDDRILARWVGVSIGEWSNLKTMALHGWIRCSDGRLYHPLIADLAVEAFSKRRGQSERANSRWAKARAAKAAPEMPGQADTDAAAQSSDAAACATVMQGTGTVEGTDPPLSPPLGAGELFGEAEEPEPPDETRTAFDLWNETAKRCGLPVAKFLDDNRRKAIRKRLEAGGLELWTHALGAVEVSAFCRGLRPGSDGRTFRADLTFVCQAKSFQRLVDGGYGTDAPPPRAAGPTRAPEDPWRTRAREFSRNRHWNEVDWGPRPGRQGCRVSPEIQREFGIEPAQPQVVRGAA